MKYLVSASRASRNITWLWVLLTFFCFLSFFHHKGETNISTDRILVPLFTRVFSRSIRGVSIESFERVEVLGSTRLAWVPFSVNILLSIVIPKLFVVLSVFEVNSSALTSNSESRRSGESACTSDEGRDGNNLSEL